MSFAFGLSAADVAHAPALPTFLLVATVAFLGVIAAMTGNFDMGGNAASLLIGP